MRLLTLTVGLEPDIIFRGMEREEERRETIFSSEVDRKALGKQVAYSDIGFLLLEMMLERAGTNLAEFLDRRLFKSLEERRTGYLPKGCEDGVATEYCPWRKKMIQREIHDEKSFLLGGVTGSQLAFFKNGRRRAERTGGALNPLSQSWEGLCKTFQGLLFGLSPDIPIVLGLAGRIRQREREKVRGFLADMGWRRIVITSDVHLALMGAHQGEPGILLLAGTGSMALAFDKGEFIRRGGLGHLFGDEGSGYSLDLRALKEAASELEEGGGEIAKILEKELGFTGLPGLISWVYHSERTKDHIAALVPILLVYPQAERLFYKEARELTELLFRLLHALERPLPICLGGGFLMNTDQGKRVKEIALKRNPNLQFTNAQGDALDGGRFFL